MRRGDSGDWSPMSEFLRKQGGRLLSHARTFSGAYGLQYRWKLRGWRRRSVLTLDNDPHAEGSPPALAAFHDRKRNALLKVVRKAYLEVSPNLTNIDTLDSLIRTHFARLYSRISLNNHSPALVFSELCDV
ncbi:hypothetical protein BOTBODRAFT_29846 [Botryobasidium botryosum FD-172 SS1]|uniref:DUF6593 domain-containing protein n=1 Tax=Botryobasidium botryosum (strain FD-172 SS1) TaxID=930990 RepID=A0A067MPL0_BOTB1|nr:hypothetical protein BOTBODRAFT_29846 [Botryobasidium botryosum FD-172 SS1]